MVTSPARACHHVRVVDRGVRGRRRAVAVSVEAIGIAAQDRPQSRLAPVSVEAIGIAAQDRRESRRAGEQEAVAIDVDPKQTCHDRTHTKVWVPRLAT